MTDYGRRIVVDLDFETALSELSQAIREEGLVAIARVDLRDHFWRDLGREFRRYFLIDAWTCELAFDALRLDLEVGTILAATFAIYELPDGETAVIAKAPLSEAAADPDWRSRAPALAPIADRQRDQVARVVARLQHAASRQVLARAVD